MAKHKPLCLVVTILTIIGALNWGLIGLGGLLQKDWNVVHMILQSLPYQVEAIVYLLVGVAGVLSLAFLFMCKDCACQHMDKK